MIIFAVRTYGLAQPEPAPLLLGLCAGRGGGVGGVGQACTAHEYTFLGGRQSLAHYMSALHMRAGAGGATHLLHPFRSFNKFLSRRRRRRRRRLGLADRALWRMVGAAQQQSGAEIRASRLTRLSLSA